MLPPATGADQAKADRLCHRTQFLPV
jgi:hypothetical protein